MNRRLAAYIVLIIIALLVFKCIVFAFDTHSAEADVSRYMIYQVRSGDTLWTIAKQYVSQDKDIRKYIYEIMKENRLQTASLEPGQVLNIPLNR